MRGGYSFLQDLLTSNLEDENLTPTFILFLSHPFPSLSTQTREHKLNLNGTRYLQFHGNSLYRSMDIG